MSVKRRDNKNRVLRNGESQCPDGRYVYKYYDIMKKPHLQYLMGHSEISVTMDTYTNLGLDDA